MGNLFGIAEKYDYLVSKIEDNNGELTDEIASELEITEKELEDKLRAYRLVIESQKANIEYNKDEIKRLQERNKSFDKIQYRLKEYVKFALHKFGVAGKSLNYSLKYPDFTVYTKESESITVDEDSMKDLISNMSCINHMPFDINQRRFWDRCYGELDFIGDVEIKCNIPLSKLTNVTKCLMDNNITDIDPKFKFNKRAIKELDSFGRNIASSETTNAEANIKLQNISDVMNYINMERVISETVIYK